MADPNMNTYDTLQEDVREHLAEKTLPVALRTTKFYAIADKYPLEAHQGKTFNIVRYEELDLPRTSIVEGTNPAQGRQMTITKVTAIADQWGDYCTLTDVAMLTIAHPILEKATELLGVQAGKVYDREIQQVLEGCTNVQYADNSDPKTNASRNAIGTSDVFAYTDSQVAIANLRDNGAETFEGDYYHGVVDTSVEQDIIAETTFKDAATYSQVIKLIENEIGKWGGVRWVRTNFMQKYMAIAAPEVDTEDEVAGTLTAVSHDVVIVGIRTSTGFEERISATATVTPTADKSINVHIPTDTDYVYEIYVGLTSSGAEKTALGEQEAGDVVTVSAVGTGDAAPVAPGATNRTIHNVWIFGKGAFGVTEVQKLTRTLTKNEATTDDPLNLTRKTGWKGMFKAVITNNNFMRKTECYSKYLWMFAIGGLMALMGATSDAAPISGDLTIDQFEYDRQVADTTYFHYTAGRIRNDTRPISIAAGSVSLTTNDRNFIEISFDGTVSANINGFSAGAVPLYSVYCDTSDVQKPIDKRTFLYTPGQQVRFSNSEEIFNSTDGILGFMVDDDTVLRLHEDKIEAETDIWLPLDLYIDNSSLDSTLYIKDEDGNILFTIADQGTSGEIRAEDIYASDTVYATTAVLINDDTCVVTSDSQIQLIWGYSGTITLTNGLGADTHTFPTAFTETPYAVACFTENVLTGDDTPLIWMDNISTTQGCARCAGVNPGDLGGEINYNVIVIGNE